MEAEFHVIALYYFYLYSNVFKSSKFVKYDQRIIPFFPPIWQPTEVLKSKGLRLSGCCARGLVSKQYFAVPPQSTQITCLKRTIYGYAFRVRVIVRLGLGVQCLWVFALFYTIFFFGKISHRPNPFYCHIFFSLFCKYLNKESTY